MGQVPNKLIALVFDDKYRAEEARAALHRMEGEGLLDIDESAIVVKQEDGKVRIAQDVNVVSNDRKVGQMLGLVTAALTGTFPFIFVGTVAGHLVGKLTDHGVTNKFIEQVGDKVQPGTSALILLARSDAQRRRKILEKMREFKPDVLETDLPPELEQELTAALQ